MAIGLCTQDHYNISDAQISMNKYDEFMEKTKKTANDSVSSQSVLKIVLDATRSGSIVNRRMYTATSMERKHMQFVTPNQKPVLKNHDSSNVDSSIGRITDVTFERLAKKDDEYYNDFKYAKRGAKGSSRILLDAEIIDSDAQQKIIDKRYLTVSTGQQLGKAICSHCGVDWMQKYCDHFPGETAKLDEGSPLVTSKVLKKDDVLQMFLITDIADYNEVSFVNIPAQSLAKVTQIKDSLTSIGYSDKNNLSRLCDVFISQAFTRERDCVYDICMQTAAETHGLLADDYRDHIRQSIIGKTTVVMSAPATNQEQDFPKNKVSASPQVNKDKVVDSTTEDNSVNNNKKETIRMTKANEDANEASLDALKLANSQLEANIKVLNDSLNAEKSVSAKLAAEKSDLIKKSADFQANMLLTMRKVTGRVSAEDVEGDKGIKYLDALKARSLESLTDSVEDEKESFLKAINELKKDASKNAGDEAIVTPVKNKKDDSETSKPVNKKEIL